MRKAKTKSMLKFNERLSRSTWIANFRHLPITQQELRDKIKIKIKVTGGNPNFVVTDGAWIGGSSSLNIVEDKENTDTY